MSRDAVMESGDSALLCERGFGGGKECQCRLGTSMPGEVSRKSSIDGVSDSVAAVGEMGVAGHWPSLMVSTEHLQ